jgi:trehalose 6-phosphate phosphatase
MAASAAGKCKSRDASSKETLISSGQPDPLPVPPRFLLEGASLFLDFDGTLVDLIERPDDVVADDALRTLLSDLHIMLGGRLAIISGRSLAQLDAILGPVAQSVALSGSHGSEHRWQGVSAQPHRPAALNHAVARLRSFADTRPGMFVEEKSYGVALHYRNCPEAEQDAVKAARDLAAELELHLQDGKMMVELRVPGDKGAAVRRLMNRLPMQGTRPIFIGDDRTDESAFATVAELGGFGVLVGSPRETAASFGLPDPASVRAWLAERLT